MKNNKVFRKLIFLVSILLDTIFGFGIGVGIKKTRTIFVHKLCPDGQCLSHEHAYYVQESLDDIRYYVENIEKKDTSHKWSKRITKRTREIDNIIK